MSQLTPREIVGQLDRYIVGQHEAKKSVAIALRNRWRRQQATDDMKDEIIPNNIIMIGPTGVGKTEIARRLAKLVAAPFVKVEASNYTEVGYVGRDVESMIRDLVEIAIGMVREEQREKMRGRVEVAVEERLVDLLMPTPTQAPQPATPENEQDTVERRERTRAKLREKLRSGELEERKVSVKMQPQGGPTIEIFSRGGNEDMGIQFPGGQFNPFGQQKTKDREMTIRQAREHLRTEEGNRMMDMEKIVSEARERVESNGLVFIDEIDKIAGASSKQGPDVSREGVQRDLLPIVEGAAVNTRHGVIRTDHILFIAAGAFNVSRPSDLIPEFQGRFPNRVELNSLGQAEFVRILTEPANSLTKQYQALLGSEGCALEFTDEAIEEIARVSATANERAENIGARRLRTVLSTLLEEVLFELPESKQKKITFTGEDVTNKLDGILADEDLTRYIL